MKLALLAVLLLGVVASPAFGQLEEDEDPMSLYSMYSLNEKPVIMDRYGPCCFILEWVNNDVDGHTVTSVNGAFDSGPLKKGESFKYAFDKPGTYEYYSKLFPDYIYKVVIYNPETECTPTGCGVTEDDITFSEMDPKLKQEAIELQKQLLDLNKEFNRLDRIDSATKNDAVWQQMQELVKQKELIEKRLSILAKNDPNCIALDRQGNCVYEPKVIQQTFNGPTWIQKIFSWNEQGLLSDSEIITTLKWLIQNGLITA